jgi:hypothetical protein
MVRAIRRFIGEMNREAPLSELFGAKSWRENPD